MPAEWEQIRERGRGGQSIVYLVRTKERSKQRSDSLTHIIRNRPSVTTQEDRQVRENASYAEAIYNYTRPELPSELAALKQFIVRGEGQEAEQQALDRLKQEIQVLSEGHTGLPKLLDSDIRQRWIVTEYFPKGTLAESITKYKGNVPAALKAFRSLVSTVAMLHTKKIVHRDIKPANIFIREDDELILGDFGIAYLLGQSNRLTRTHESVGPSDYMPWWAGSHGRLDKVEADIDVYMLGKLLWLMVAGQHYLDRERWNKPENNLTQMFPENPHTYMVNAILEKCVNEEREDCKAPASELLAMTNSFLLVIERGGQLLWDGVPRPCRVCGSGAYMPVSVQGKTKDFTIRLWHGGGANDISPMGAEVFACEECGHIQFFLPRVRPKVSN